MTLFDEDRNGIAVIEDINRVLATYTDMSETDQAKFVKVCALGHNLDEKQLNAKLKELNLPAGFSIKQAIAHLFNI